VAVDSKVKSRESKGVKKNEDKKVVVHPTTQHTIAQKNSAVKDDNQKIDNSTQIKNAGQLKNETQHLKNDCKPEAYQRIVKEERKLPITNPYHNKTQVKHNTQKLPSVGSSHIKKPVQQSKPTTELKGQQPQLEKAHAQSQDLTVEEKSIIVEERKLPERTKQLTSSASHEVKSEAGLRPTSEPFKPKSKPTFKIHQKWLN